jgi:hypothetical protein
LQIEYLRSNGTVLCVKSYQLMCEEDCCDYFTLSQEAIGSGSSTACCSYLDLNAIEGACDIYGIRIVGGTGGITFNPSQKITVPPPGVPFRIGEWCLGEGTTGSVKVELLGLDGSVVCTKTLTGSCNHSGGGTLRLNSADPGRSSEDPSAESAGAATLVAIPNPTSGMTTLRYRLPVDADVRLEVFDARGARMASIGGGAAKAGTHELSYDTADLPSGEYLVKLSYGKNVVSIPLTIAR